MTLETKPSFAASVFCLCLPLLLLLVVPGFTGCTGSNISPCVLSGMTMGTTWMAKFSAPAQWEEGGFVNRRALIRKAIDEELDAVNQRMSVFRPSSEISRFNCFLSTEWFGVSRELAVLVKRALDIHRFSYGALDITIGPLIRLWGFGPGGERRIPTIEKIQFNLERCGGRYLDVCLEPPALRKKIPELECNLSSLAKGYGVDRLAAMLDQWKITDYLVEIGGEVRARGERPGGGPWQIGVMEPEKAGGVRRVVRLKDLSMATSGDYQNYFEVDGIRYSHTIDPRTGHPVRHNLASVTVVADTCMIADAWATALLVMGPVKAKKLALERSLCVFLVERSGREYREFMTPVFRELLVDSGSRQP
ncbi:MAG TPA: FAD:protein FMN transferase [Candidatus Aminicenantes bacterium]|nr:FAD:protein FMN transferase [Candidatus Aminicenantes bacterium]